MILSRILAGSTLALGLLCVVLWVRLEGKDTEIAKLHTAAAQADAAIAGEREAFERNAREAEQLHRQALAQAEADYLTRIEDGKRKADAVVADLRAGTLRLRREWQGCETASLVSGATASAGSADAEAELRAAGAAHLVRLGAQCDAWVRGLQQAVRAPHAN